MVNGCDMIVSLTNLPEYVLSKEYRIERAFVGDRNQIISFVKEKFPDHHVWPIEVEHAIMQETVKCFIAVKDKSIVGFACFDVCSKSFFGPLGVDPAERKKNIGKALLIRTLNAMKDYGYGYAIIGWVDEAKEFYKSSVNAQIIAGSSPENSVFSRYIDIESV